MIIKLDIPQKANLLFDHWNETIIWSCLQGIMGEIYADNGERPMSAMAVLGDFCFLAGVPNRDLVLYRPDCCHDEVIMVPQNDIWSGLIESCYGTKAEKITRHAIKKEPDVFNQSKLRQAALSLPPGFTIRMIDEDLYNMCKSNAWSRDLVSQYPDYGMYERLGLGVVALKDGQPVSGASSYTAYQEGIEIEIDTREEYRRMGLAYACGARLILECLAHGIYPSWDAHNLESAALAEKLGYHYDRPYTAFLIHSSTSMRK